MNQKEYKKVRQEVHACYHYKQEIEDLRAENIRLRNIVRRLNEENKMLLRMSSRFHPEIEDFETKKAYELVAMLNSVRNDKEMGDEICKD